MAYFFANRWFAFQKSFSLWVLLGGFYGVAAHAHETGQIMNLPQQRNQPMRRRLHHLCAALCGGGGGIASGSGGVVILNRPAQLGAAAIADEMIFACTQL